jgi:hypothetical protein
LQEFPIKASLRRNCRAIPLQAISSEVKLGDARLAFCLVDTKKLSPLITQNQEFLRLIEEDPRVEILSDAIYTPWEAIAKNAWPVLYDAAGSVVESTILRKGPHGWSDKFDARPPEPTIRSGSSGKGLHIYLGTMPQSHFGHFLTEGLSRLWYLPHAPKDAVFLYHGPPVELWPTYARNFLQVLGLEEKLIRFKTATRVDRLVVPGPSMINGYCVHRSHAVPGQLYSSALWTTDPPAKLADDTVPLYLSRRRLRGDRRLIAAEVEIERALSSVGAEIAHPQNLSLKEQVELFRRHDPIIGPTGSAFHTSLLAGTSSRTVYLAGEFSTANQVLIDALMNNSTCYVRTLRDGFHGSMRPDQATVNALKQGIRA